MRVALLPTGLTEWHGLAQALQSLFPGTTFYCLPTEAEVNSERDHFPYPGFTSDALTEEHVRQPPESARELVERAAQEALGDRRREAADLVFILDDVELPNAGQIDRVAKVMHNAVAVHLTSLSQPKNKEEKAVAKIQEKTAIALRDKVSFHLIGPMIEAWFFADPGALKMAGVPPSAQVYFAATTDPEAFVTDDAAYLAATEADCPGWTALNLPQKKRKFRPKWLGSQPREQHPKGYLQWLCCLPTERTCTSYSETQSGGRALAGIDWPQLFKRNTTHFSLLRALIEDLADGLGYPPVIQTGSPSVPLPVERSRAPMNAVLRNL